MWRCCRDEILESAAAGGGADAALVMRGDANLAGAPGRVVALELRALAGRLRSPGMSTIEILSLGGAGVAAGVINAIAGGCTLVTFPMLLLFGTPPVVANATSTVALVIGTPGSMFGYRRHLESVKPRLSTFLPVSILGGFIGSVLLTQTSDKIFSRMIPFLILFATVLFLAQGFVRRQVRFEANPEGSDGRVRLFGTILFQLGVAIYGGYFGAGIGILMLASLGIIGLHDIHEMNTLKTVLGSAINLVAAGWFIVAGLIHWPKACVMTVGALAGYYLGSHYAQRIPQKYVRTIITGIGFVLSGVAFYKEFLS